MGEKTVKKIIRNHKRKRKEWKENVGSHGLNSRRQSSDRRIRMASSIRRCHYTSCHHRDDTAAAAAAVDAAADHDVAWVASITAAAAAVVVDRAYAGVVDAAGRWIVPFLH